MAETEINVVNRPGAILSTITSVWPVLAGCVLACGWLYHLEGATTANTGQITDIKAAIIERDARWVADQAAQNVRVDRIEEGRTVGLQRLSAVEEAVKGQKDILKDISAKLDRALTGGRVR